VTVAACEFTNPADVRHRGSASATTPRFVTRCCSCFIFFNPSYPSSKSSHIRSSFTTHFEQTFVRECKSQPTSQHCSLSQPHVNVCVLETIMVLPSVERNSCE
jgi:hypothetical protein